jgi:hypothetical protein
MHICKQAMQCNVAQNYCACQAQWFGSDRVEFMLPSTLSRFESSGLLPLRTPEVLCVCSSCWQRRGIPPSHCGCLSDYPQLPRHLCTDAAVHAETSRGVYWISWGHFEHLWQMCTFICNSQMKCFGTHVDMDMFPVLVCGTRAQTCPYLSVTLYIAASSNKLSKNFK